MSDNDDSGARAEMTIVRALLTETQDEKCRVFAELDLSNLDLAMAKLDGLRDAAAQAKPNAAPGRRNLGAFLADRGVTSQSPSTTQVVAFSEGRSVPKEEVPNSVDRWTFPPNL